MFSKYPRKTRCLLWTAIVGAFLTVFSLLFALVILPAIIDKIIKDNLVLTENTEAWDRFMELPFPLDTKIYIFEVTNPDSVIQNGSKPYLKQVGPFVYKTSRTKFNVERLDDEHVSYYTRQMYEFDRERSAHSDEYEHLGLNFLPVGAFQILENAKIGFDYDVEKLLPHVMKESKLFTKTRVKDFLFDGISFCDPTTKFIPAKMICLMVILMNLKMITYNDDLSMHYSTFGWLNNSHDGKFVINTGEKDIMKLGQIQSWNDMEFSKFWKGTESKCNKVSGYDIAIFAPYMKDGEGIDIYSTNICRILTLEFLKKDVYRDIDVNKYGFTKKSFRPENCDDPNDSCYCSDYTRGLDGEKSCFLDGVQDIYPCTGTPGLVSLPHFLNADKKYLDTVENLQPSEDLHLPYFRIHPLVAVPMDGWMSLQMNLIIRPMILSNKPVEMTRHLANTSLPAMWFQQGLAITDDYYDFFDYVMNMKAAAEIGKWVFVLISGLIFICPVAKLLVGTM